MARTPYPSIPAPGDSIPQLVATVNALVQVVRLLVVNTQPATSQGLTTGAQTFYSANASPSVLDRVTQNGASIKVLDTSVATLDTSVATLDTSVATLDTEVATLNTEVATLTPEVAALNAEVATLNTEVATLNSEVGVIASGTGLVGTLASGTLTVSGAANLGTAAPYTLDIPGSLLGAGTVTSAQLAANSATTDSGEVSSSSTATCTLTLGVSGDAIVVASYTGTGVSTPAGTGELIISVDGTPQNAIPLSSVSGNVILRLGFIWRRGSLRGRIRLQLGRYSLRGRHISTMWL